MTMITTQMKISDFTPLCTTRSRAKEASAKLIKKLQLNSGVEIDIGCCEIVSVSFLDELLTNLQSILPENKIVFRINDQALEDKLALVSGMKSIDIFYRINDEKVRKVVPRYVVSHEPEFQERK